MPLIEGSFFFFFLFFRFLSKFIEIFSKSKNNKIKAKTQSFTSSSLLLFALTKFSCALFAEDSFFFFFSNTILWIKNNEVLGRFRFLQQWAFLGTETPIISLATFQCLEDLAGRQWLLSSTTMVEYSSSSSSPSSHLKLILFLLLWLFINDSRSLLLRNFTASCNSTWPSSATKRNEIHIHTHKHIHKFVAISYKVHIGWVLETIASVMSSRRLLTLSFFFF